jgi:hypothetical protein
MKPLPMLPEPVCRSMTKILRMSRSTSATQSPSSILGSTILSPVTMEPGLASMTRMRLPSAPLRAGMRKSSAVSHLTLTESRVGGPRARRLDEEAAVLRDEDAVLEDHARAEVLEGVEGDEVGLVAGGYRSRGFKAEPLRGVEAGDAEGVDGVDAAREEEAQGVVHVPLVHEVVRVPVVGADEEARGRARPYRGYEVHEVARRRALPQHDVHALG